MKGHSGLSQPLYHLALWSSDEGPGYTYTHTHTHTHTHTLYFMVHNLVSICKVGWAEVNYITSLPKWMSEVSIENVPLLGKVLSKYKASFILFSLAFMQQILL
jgi:hypothetical protein